MNRYPEIFVKSQIYINTSSYSKILSFGCSTGEEAFTLRGYFPLAKIVGVDINSSAINIAKGRNKDDLILFAENRREFLEQEAPFDAIFCLNVLKRSQLIRKNNSKFVYPFERFNQQISELDDLLRVGGILVLYRTNFRFSDTSVAHKYEVHSEKKFDETAKFDRNNRRIKRTPLYEYIYVKREE